MKEIDQNLSIRIGDVTIQRVSHSKLVGVHIYEGLTWNEHVDHIIKKVLASLKAKRSVRDFADIPSLVEPYFEYCSNVWDSLENGLSAKLQKFQNRAACIVTRSDDSVRSVKLLKQLNWKTLSQKCICSKAIMMYKALNGLAPNYLREKFPYVSQRHKYTLRNSDVNLILPRPNTEYGKKYFFYSETVLWSSITGDIRRSRNLRNFRISVNRANGKFKY